MMALLKENIPPFVWDATRSIYVYMLRLFLDILQTASFIHPINWIHTLFLVRMVRPEYTMVRPPRLRVLYELSQKN